MPDSPISQDDPILALDDAMYFPIVDPNEPLASNQNKRVLSSLLKTVFATLANSNTFQGIITFVSSIKLAVSDDSETLPDNKTVYILDGETTTLSMPTVVDNTPIWIKNDSASTKITLNGDIRHAGSNVSSMTMRGGTTRMFIGYNSRWLSL